MSGVSPFLPVDLRSSSCSRSHRPPAVNLLPQIHQASVRLEGAHYPLATRPVQVIQADCRGVLLSVSAFCPFTYRLTLSRSYSVFPPSACSSSNYSIAPRPHQRHQRSSHHIKPRLEGIKPISIVSIITIRIIIISAYPQDPNYSFRSHYYDIPMKNECPYKDRPVSHTFTPSTRLLCMPGFPASDDHPPTILMQMTQIL